MGSVFMDRFEAIRGVGGIGRSIGIDASDLLARLGRDRTLKPLATELDLKPSEMIAVLAFGALGDGQHEIGPALVRGRSTDLGAEPAFSETSLADLYPGAPRPERLALSAGLLQVHDAWDASHTAAQEADDLGESSVSAYWHGIAHRREPDPGNAAYWFRRVGRHPIFGPLSAAARPMVEKDTALAGRLLPGGEWAPFAFIDLCTRAGGERATLLRKLQRLEMLLLLGASIPG